MHSRRQLMLVTSMQTDAVKIMDLGAKLWQNIADWLPSFGERVHLLRTSSSMSFEWRLAPPAVFAPCMAGMNIGNTGARAVAQALAAGLVHPHHIARLRLSNNGIADDGATALAEALAVSNVTRIYLENNQIGDVGAHALSAVFRWHACLKEMDLRHNSLSEACKSDLRTCAKQGIIADWSDPSPTYMKDVQFTRVRIEESIDEGDPPIRLIGIYDEHMVSEEMRTRMVDWLFAVCSPSMGVLISGIEAEGCYHLSCSILDRYLSRRPVAESQLHLLVLAILLLAQDAQLEEHSTIAEGLATRTRAHTTPEQILTLAFTVQEALVHLKQPTTFTLATRYMCYIGHNEDSWSLVRYLLVLSTHCYTFLKYKPCAVAAAAVIVAGTNLSESGAGYPKGWQKALFFWLQNDCEEAELLACLEDLSSLHVAAYERREKVTHSSSDAMRKSYCCFCAVAEFAADRIFSSPDNNAVALKKPVHVQSAHFRAQTCSCCAGSGQVEKYGPCPLCDGHGYM